MKILSSTTNHMLYTNQANPSATGTNSANGTNMEKAAEGNKTDSINISQKTKDLQSISASMDSEPTDRKKIVAGFKEQVQANQYTVNFEKTAEKMIGNIIDDVG